MFYGIQERTWISRPDPRDKENLRLVSEATLSVKKKHGPMKFVITDHSNGEIYKVLFGYKNKCTCGLYMNCLHVLFVMLEIFGFPEENPLLYQKGLVDHEIDQIVRYTGNPWLLPKSSLHEHNMKNKVSKNGIRRKFKRKVEEGDECPICCEPLLKNGKCINPTNCNICGNNMHKKCMLTWSRQPKYGVDKKVTCPMCRGVWTFDEVSGLSRRPWKPSPCISEKKGKLKFEDLYWDNGINKTRIFRKRRVSRTPKVVKMRPSIRSNHFEFTIKISEFTTPTDGESNKIKGGGIEIGIQDKEHPIPINKNLNFKIGQKGYGWGWRSPDKLILPNGNEKKNDLLLLKNGNNEITIEVNLGMKKIFVFSDPSSSSYTGKKCEIRTPEDFPKVLEIIVVIVGKTYSVELTRYKEHDS